MKYPASLKNKKYPVFIRTNSHIKKYGKPLNKNFKNYIPEYTEPFSCKAEISLSDFVDKLCKIFKNCGLIKNNKLVSFTNKININSIKKNNKLVLPSQITLYDTYHRKNVSFKKGSSILELLTHLEDECGINEILDLIELGIGLELSWKKNLKIVFSSHPWDIATMSMRGIRSCQAWNKPQKNHLIGSILDPNVAVIYLTDGKPHKNYGPKMLARSVVRLCIPYVYAFHGSHHTKPFGDVPVPLCERAYSFFAKGQCVVEYFNKIFKISIEEHLASIYKTPEIVKQFNNRLFFHKSLPITKEIRKLPGSQLSYIDGSAQYINL